MWRVEEIPTHFASVYKLAHRCGYIAAIFGSTVCKGQGRDLDILMSPLANRAQQMRRFASEFGGNVVRRNLKHDLGIRSYEVEKDGRIFHFVFGSVRG